MGVSQMGDNQIQNAFDNAEPVAPFDGGYGHNQGPDMDENLPPPPSMPGEDSPEARACLYPLNDLGNGQRLTEYYGQDILFVPRLGWFRWEGKRWGADEDELRVRRDAQAVSGRILDEIPFIQLDEWQREALDLWREVKPELLELEKIKERNDEQKKRFRHLRDIQVAGVEAEEALKGARKAHRAHSKASGNTSKISNMLAEAKVSAAVEVGVLNANPYMLNTEGGVVSFTQEEDEHEKAWGDQKPKWRADVLPHDRRHMISKMAQAEYDPDAECPHFIDLMDTIQPDREIREFLQRWFGYSLLGLTDEQNLVFLYGIGRNGKSTLVDIIAQIMDDYGTTLPIETLTGSEQRKGSDATPDLVRLPGARFVRASEPDQGQRLKENLVKALTGGEAILIRRMQQEFVEIEPEFKLTISGNHRPEVRGGDDGIWRRIVLVPFDEQIAEADVDRDLPRKLKKEKNGILNWLIEGCLSYLNTGLRVPEKVVAATNDYRNESDPYRTFLMDQEFVKITGSPDDFVIGRDFADAFNAYLVWREWAPFGRRTVSNNIKSRVGVVKGPNGETYRQGKRSDTGWVGLKLMPKAYSVKDQFEYEVSDALRRKG